MAFGKKNIIKPDPLKYNVGIIGESGIGKTTIVKEYCEKLAGENGYLFLEIGKEDGADAIHGINWEPCEDWEKFESVIDDIVENKDSEYPDLKIVVFDTYDELFSIAEPEVIRMHNNENPKKRTKSIKAAFGGFQGGEDKVIEIVLNKIWSLKKVGVRFVVIGHTKSKSKDDAVSGEAYSQLTSNISQKYFNAIKTKLHFLGVAAIDRMIVKKKTGKKDFVTQEDVYKGIIQGETRKITFRDDNYVIDSKSRFADIIPQINMNSDELIDAITNAIIAEQSKSGKSYKEALKEDAVNDKEETAKRKAKKELDESKKQIISFFSDNKENLDKIKVALSKVKEYGYENPTEIDNLECAKEILAFTLTL